MAAVEAGGDDVVPGVGEELRQLERGGAGAQEDGGVRLHQLPGLLGDELLPVGVGQAPLGVGILRGGQQGPHGPGPRPGPG